MYEKKLHTAAAEAAAPAATPAATRAAADPWIHGSIFLVTNHIFKLAVKSTVESTLEFKIVPNSTAESTASLPSIVKLAFRACRAWRARAYPGQVPVFANKTITFETRLNAFRRVKTRLNAFKRV